MSACIHSLIKSSNLMTVFSKSRSYWIFFGLLITGVISFFHSTDVNAESTLQFQNESVKQDVIQINRELSQLEQSLLYPVSTRLGLYLSIKTRQSFQLNSIDIKIDGQNITTYLYTTKELKALERGGIQRLYMSNLATGHHQLTVIFNGQGTDEHFFRRKKQFQFEKGNGIKNIELEIVDSDFKKEPVIKINTWNN